jgi:hypothetical protein
MMGGTNSFMDKPLGGLVTKRMLITQFPQVDALYVKERTTYGETVSIRGKDAITAAKEAVTRSAPTKTLGKHRA